MVPERFLISFYVQTYSIFIGIFQRKLVSRDTLFLPEGKTNMAKEIKPIFELNQRVVNLLQTQEMIKTAGLDALVNMSLAILPFIPSQEEKVQYVELLLESIADYTSQETLSATLHKVDQFLLLAQGHVEASVAKRSSEYDDYVKNLWQKLEAVGFDFKTQCQIASETKQIFQEKLEELKAK